MHACEKRPRGGGIKQEQKHSSNIHLYIFLYDFSIPEKASNNVGPIVALIKGHDWRSLDAACSFPHPRSPKAENQGKREGETDAEGKGETFCSFSPLFLSTLWRSGGEGRLFSRSIRPGRGRGHSGDDPNPEGPHHSFIEKWRGKIASLFIVHSIFLFQIPMSQTIPNNIP